MEWRPEGGTWACEDRDRGAGQTIGQPVPHGGRWPGCEESFKYHLPAVVVCCVEVASLGDEQRRSLQVPVVYRPVQRSPTILINRQDQAVEGRLVQGRRRAGFSPRDCGGAECSLDESCPWLHHNTDHGTASSGNSASRYPPNPRPPQACTLTSHDSHLVPTWSHTLSQLPPLFSSPHWPFRCSGLLPATTPNIACGWLPRPT